MITSSLSVTVQFRRVIELDRFQVAGAVRIPSGTTQSVPFGVPLPPYTPFTVLFGQNLPGPHLGVRTELAVASGKAKGDFDPVRVEPPAYTSRSWTRWG